LQTSLSGLGTIDYRSVYASSGFKEKYKSLIFLSADDFHKESKVGKFVGFASTLADIKELEVRSTGAKFAKLTLQCNDKMFSCVVWADQWEIWREVINKSKGAIIVVNAKVGDDSYAGGNQLATHKKTEFRIL
jgi:DNA polymerase III alpha subunit